MRSVLIAVFVVLGGCATSSAEQKSDPPPGKPVSTAAETSATPPPPPNAPKDQPSAVGGSNGFTTGHQRVKGGETFTLNGPTVVTVKQVTYLNQPCPPNVECLTSGIIRTVQFTVAKGSDVQTMSVNSGTFRVAGGVQLRVVNVEAGPTAEVEVSLPVAPVGG